MKEMNSEFRFRYKGKQYSISKEAIVIAEAYAGWKSDMFLCDNEIRKACFGYVNLTYRPGMKNLCSDEIDCLSFFKGMYGISFDEVLLHKEDVLEAFYAIPACKNRWEYAILSAAKKIREEGDK